MKQMELFAGIGGFGLAGRWAGIESAVQVEWNPFCQKVLKKNFPNAELHGDIREFDGTPYRGTIDIISGGFPCQPYSTAGKRLGKEDDRHLWPEMLRVIRQVAPRWVVGENVRGLVNWSGGLVFDEAQADLEAAGYEVQPFVLPAASVNAPHRRDRVWFVAYANNKRREKQYASDLSIRPGRIGRRIFAEWDDWPTQPPVCRGNDGIPNRVDRIRGLGNAIVPQVAYQIFKAIVEYETHKRHSKTRCRR